AIVYVVGPGNKAIQKEIKADRTQGAFWVVTGGLNPGDKIITQGTAKVRVNQPVKPVPATAPQKIDPNRKGPGAGGSGGRRG
ncbi:MAG: efflux transporter periplasmic adaptor subunit, partial [Proteobacteria bacterium]|nr:efflux transporter periplasmic adaptor subunit [Pseudomonadota bacterium]